MGRKAFPAIPRVERRKTAGVGISQKPAAPDCPIVLAGVFIEPCADVVDDLGAMQLGLFQGFLSSWNLQR